MNRFSTAADAKEFLVSRILQEAERVGVDLSRVERTMLFFSETDDPTPEALQAAAIFESEQDTEVFEKKLARLIRNAHRRDRKMLPDGKPLWKDAIKSLREGDHYLLVLVDEALGTHAREGEWWRLPVSALAVAVLGVAFVVSLRWFDENYWFSERARLAILLLLAAAAWAILASGVVEKMLNWISPIPGDTRGKRAWKNRDL